MKELESVNDNLPSKMVLRVVSVCITGWPARGQHQNDLRARLLRSVGRQIGERNGWSNLDAVVLPAGYFRLADWLGPNPAWLRAHLLADTPIGINCTVAAQCVSRQSPGCVLVIGIDGNRPVRDWRGDQLAAAFDSSGPITCARKVFPVWADTRPSDPAQYVVFEHDAYDPGRFVKLPSGATALLNICYDAFAIAEIARGPTRKRLAIRYLATTEGGWRLLEDGEADELLERYRVLLQSASPSVALVPIHSFAAPGRDGLWQRHGIATASAGLQGALVVGASHFDHRLPARLDASPLASVGVARDQLYETDRRKAHKLDPIDGFVARLGQRGPQALVRLFAPS